MRHKTAKKNRLLERVVQKSNSLRRAKSGYCSLRRTKEYLVGGRLSRSIKD